MIDFATLVNTGSVAVSSGTLDLQTGGTATSSFSAGTGSTLKFEHGPWAFNTGSSVTGAGTVQFPFSYWPASFNSGSTFNVSGATIVQATQVNFLAGSSAMNVGALTITNQNSTPGYLRLASGTQAQSVSLTQSTGTLTGPDTLVVSGPSTLTGGDM